MSERRHARDPWRFSWSDLSPGWRRTRAVTAVASRVRRRVTSSARCVRHRRGRARGRSGGHRQRLGDAGDRRWGDRRPGWCGGVRGGEPTDRGVRRRGSRRRRCAWSRRAGRTGSILGPATGTASGVRGALQDAKGGASRTASAARGSVAEHARSLRERSRSLSTDVAAQVRSAPETSPMATALLPFAAGLVVGLALPPTDREHQMAGMLRGQVIEPVKSHAAQAGRAVAAELSLPPGPRRSASRAPLAARWTGRSGGRGVNRPGIRGGSIPWK